MSALKVNNTRKQAGFSLTELLAVVAIIAIISAVSMPAISRYIRNYRIRAASQAVASELNAARTKAIMKNVNLGVDFVIVSPTTFRYVIEDRQVAGSETGARDQISAILANAALTADQVGPLQTLPLRVTFGTACTPAGGFTPNDRGVRFNRMGGWCNPGSSATSCPDFDTGSILMNVQATTATICLVEQDTNLWKILTLNAAGRILEQQ
jgi:prepilin-type N-terminal cleavage/methylation domain-containing protein